MTLDKRIETVRVAIIRKIGDGSYLRPAGLSETLTRMTGEDPISVKQALGRLSREGWLEGVSDDGVPFARVRILGEIPKEPMNPVQSSWIDAMREASFSDNEVQALTGCWKNLDGFSQKDMIAIANGLFRLRDEQETLNGLPTYIVSSRYLLGSSKLLDRMGVRALGAFGIDVTHFQSHPPYIVVAGSHRPETVILVENPAAFELAITTEAVRECSFVATFGFGLSKTTEDYGNQLAGIVESRFQDAITLVREGSSCPPVRELLSCPKITFWGDLDPAGIAIYLRLKRNLPLFCLSAIYQPMVKMLADPVRSHPYVDGVGKAGQAAMTTIQTEIDEKASWLLEQCRIRGVDQEAVLPEDICSFANEAF